MIIGVFIFVSFVLFVISLLLDVLFVILKEIPIEFFANIFTILRWSFDHLCVLLGKTIYLLCDLYWIIAILINEYNFVYKLPFVNGISVLSFSNIVITIQCIVWLVDKYNDLTHS